MSVKTNRLEGTAKSKGRTSTEIDMDGLDGGVVGKRIFSQLAPDTTLLESAEGDLRVEQVVAVDWQDIALYRQLVARKPSRRSTGAPQTVPALSPCATLRARLMSREKTAAASPYLARGRRRSACAMRKPIGTVDIQGVVRLGEDVSLVLELGDNDDGAEDLFLDDAHVRLDIGEDGRLDEVSGRRARRRSMKVRRERSP